MTAMGRTNDAIIYGGRVHLFVTGPEDDAQMLAESLPSRGSRDFGAPFRAIFERFHGDFYAIDLQHLSERIAELVPQVAADEVRRRATLLAGLIEGLMVVRGAHSAEAAEMGRLAAAARGVALQIALGEYQPASALINASQ